MKPLIIIGHPELQSFCYNGIFQTIKAEFDKKEIEYEVIDLYSDKLHRNRQDLIANYQELVKEATHLYLVSPVWWFRMTPKMETFFDEVFTPGFAYKFVPLIGNYSYPKPFLSDKKVRTYITHGAPALPVRTLYLNSVKLRLVMGVYTFIFGWSIKRWTKTKQFWSVPFVTDEKRKSYLAIVSKDLIRDIKKSIL